MGGKEVGREGGESDQRDSHCTFFTRLFQESECGKNSAAGVSDELREREEWRDGERGKRERKRGRTSSVFVSHTNRKHLLRRGFVDDIVPPHRQHWVADGDVVVTTNGGSTIFGNTETG
jgi:hypothetical protein